MFNRHFYGLARIRKANIYQDNNRCASKKSNPTDS